MKLLLDTHAAIWWFGGSSRLGTSARRTLEDASNPVYLSAASVWEASIKEAAGRLRTCGPIEEAAARVGVSRLDVTWSHARAAGQLPALHADPFDRMLVARAQEEDLVILTSDPSITQYAVATIRA